MGHEIFYGTAWPLRCHWNEITFLFSLKLNVPVEYPGPRGQTRGLINLLYFPKPVALSRFLQTLMFPPRRRWIRIMVTAGMRTCWTFSCRRIKPFVHSNSQGDAGKQLQDVLMACEHCTCRNRANNSCVNTSCFCTGTWIFHRILAVQRRTGVKEAQHQSPFLLPASYFDNSLVWCFRSTSQPHYVSFICDAPRQQLAGTDWSRHLDRPLRLTDMSAFSLAAVDFPSPGLWTEPADLWLEVSKWRRK